MHAFIPFQSQEADDSDHPHQCERCGHKFKHRIRLQLHWCAGLDPDEANAERSAQEEAQRRELRSQVEAKQRQEQERKQLWSNLLQVKSSPWDTGVRRTWTLSADIEKTCSAFSQAHTWTQRDESSVASEAL